TFMNSSNDDIGVTEEGGVDVTTMVDVGKRMDGGTGIYSMDGMMGNGGMNRGEVVKPKEMGEVNDEVDVIGKGVDKGPTSDMEIGWNGHFMNVSRGMNDIFSNGILVVLYKGVDVEINVGMIDVGIMSKGVDEVEGEGEEVVDGIGS
ncbi:hypothetical protein KI387_042626, partial [Taxus chinensis]